jgi:hypothetical protein
MAASAELLAGDLSGIIVAPSSENAEGVFEAGREGLHFFPMNFQEGAKP